MADDLSKLRRLLAEVLEDFPEVQAAYLFGSAAEGRARPDSDLDIGLVVDRPLGERRLDILAALAAAGLDNVVLVGLDVDDTVLRYEAVRPNRLIYARGDFDHGSYFSRVIREYFDLLPLLEIQRAAYKRRLLHDET